ncbi:MAG: lipopolysaccharide biosynthesis protein [Clostridium sp.]|nr:lipopolysaccharide biosynthesis protein [Acetatifactor muris]MCM1526264.1 lipopolysaccharide biosynthesis protein [Bacteroides sp.]MCM1562919.1 lipopolysaccharide biosynthesis protein [Clostridium sp.]
MASKSRTEYSARNTTVAIVARVTAILMGFAARVVFTHTLSEDYVGINGLFTDILNVLALSELGVGTAITYALYRPISERDIEKQKSLMRLYRSFYRIVAGIVLLAGLLVIPFMDVLIKNQPDVEHLTLIYLMYLSNSVLSYLWVYKRTLIDAHQMSYIGVLYQTCAWIAQNILQMIVLLTTGNYILYLSVLIACTLANNICVSRKADRMYPYLRDREVRKLEREERADIFRNIRAMLLHKIGNVAVNNTDNLLLSALVGTLSVGRYSNYYLVIGSVRQVLVQMFQGITASVGNMGVEEGKERIRRIFEASFFMGQWLYGVAAICLYQVLDLFVGVSFGEKYVFDSRITLILCLNFYLTGMRQATIVFRDSMGLFRYDRYKAVAEAVINLVVSLILGRVWGTAGVFLGTLVSTVTTSLWVEPYMLYKHRLQTSSKPYFLKYFIYASVTFLLWYGEDLLCGMISGGVWTQCVLRGLFCFGATNLAYLALYHRTREFRLLWDKGVRLARKYRGRKR